MIKVIVLTAIAMVAFAANSLLCRVALRDTLIDPATFTFIRIVSGAAALALLLKLRSQSAYSEGKWSSAGALIVYAAGFSFAYIQLSAATGALLLFVAVQITMIGWGFVIGDRFNVSQSLGFSVALGGLVYLLLPGLSAPPLLSSLLMIGAGIGWGVYSLLGRGVGNPTAATGGNFVRASVLAVLLAVAGIPWFQWDVPGVIYAIISGAITSGLGYAIWYAALKDLTATLAGTIQLSVPVIAALGGMLFLDEVITLRFLIASTAILGGIAMVILRRHKVK